MNKSRAMGTLTSEKRILLEDEKKASQRKWPWDRAGRWRRPLASCAGGRGTI